MWRSGQGTVLDQSAEGPCTREHIHILMLQRRRHDEITAAAKNTRGLWPLQMFAPAEGHQIRTGSDESIQVEGGRHLRRGIHQYRKAMAMGNFHILIKRKHALMHARLVVHGDGSAGDRGFDFVRESVITESDFNESSAAGSYGVIVIIAMRAMDDELVRHSI